MAQFRKKPVVVEAITFDELVAHGISEVGAGACHNGMPWSFKYKGQSITHENDDCYLIPTLEGTMQFNRGAMLITGVNGEIYPCDAEIFAKSYDWVDPDDAQEWGDEEFNRAELRVGDKGWLDGDARRNGVR